MGTSFQFHDGVQLNILPTLRDTASKLCSKEIFVKAWSYLLNNNGNLSSTNLHRLTFSQFGQAFGLFATPVA